MEALVFVFIDCECIMIRRSVVDGMRFVPTSRARPVAVCPTKLLPWVLHVGVGAGHAARKRALLDLRVTRAILGLRRMRAILGIRLTRAILRAVPRTGSLGSAFLITQVATEGLLIGILVDGRPVRALTECFPITLGRSSTLVNCGS